MTNGKLTENERRELCRMIGNASERSTKLSERIRKLDGLTTYERIGLCAAAERIFYSSVGRDCGAEIARALAPDAYACGETEGIGRKIVAAIRGCAFSAALSAIRDEPDI